MLEETDVGVGPRRDHRPVALPRRVQELARDLGVFPHCGGDLGGDPLELRAFPRTPALERVGVHERARHSAATYEQSFESERRWAARRLHTSEAVRETSSLHGATRAGGLDVGRGERWPLPSIPSSESK